MAGLIRHIEYGFRHALVYPLLRLVFRNCEQNGIIDISKVRSVVILRYDRIGDIIVTTPIFRALKRANPLLMIGVVASPANAELILDDPNVDHVHVLDRNWFRMVRNILTARSLRYEVCLNFIFNRTTTGGILANLITPDGVKVGQGDPKYRFYFNRLLTLKRGSSHMAEVLADFVQQVFGITLDRNELAFHIAIDPATERHVNRYLSANGLTRRGGENPYVVFNLSATDAVRRISRDQGLGIARLLAGELHFNTVLTSSPADRNFRHEVVSLLNHKRCYGFPENGEATLRQLASLVQGARFVVTPDTSLVHFASAVGTPVVGLFTPLQVAAEWLPFGVRHESVFASPGSPVRDIPMAHIAEAVKHLASTRD